MGRAVGIDVLRDGEGNPGSANVRHLAGPVPGMAGWVVGGYWGAVFGALEAVIGSVRPLIPAMRGAGAWGPPPGRAS